MKWWLPLVWLGVASAAWGGSMPPVQTVFLLVFENKSWSNVWGSAEAPYLNGLLAQASYCDQYYTPPSNHPSEPNYLWLEAGTNFGIYNDDPPSTNSQTTTEHLVTLLKNAGVSWKTYQEGIDGDELPLMDDATNAFTTRHCPFLYFDDVTGTNDPTCPYGVAHVRPFSELPGDLSSNQTARYNFITPNLCDDGHNCAFSQVDAWLSQRLPMIMASPAYINNGVIFITWDEGDGDSDGPIGMIVLSPLCRGGGYHNSIHYDHGSTLRTLEEIFGVSPLLRAAAQATDLGDLFSPGPPLEGEIVPAGFAVTARGLTQGISYACSVSTNFANWMRFATNISNGDSLTFVDTNATRADERYYRVAAAR